MTTYTNYNEAYFYMEDQNRSGNFLCLVEHPSGFAVVTLREAVELGVNYEWA